MNTIICCLLFTLCFVITHGLKCYNCNNCDTFEGHSVKCSDSATRCLKSHTVFDKVVRECATEELCKQKKMKTEAYKSVHCCSGDNCNKSVRAAAPFWMSISMAAAIWKIIL